MGGAQTRTHKRGDVGLSVEKGERKDVVVERTRTSVLLPLE